MRVKLAAIGFGIALGIPVLLYGKSFGFWINYFITTDSVTDLVAYQADEGPVDAYLRNVEFYWYSVQAGLFNFFREGGPLLTWEPVSAAVFGLVPIRALEVVGLDALHYGALDTKLACVNSARLGLVFCTAPPLALGYSAYAFPFAGALLLGGIKFGVYGVLEYCWRSIEGVCPKNVWIVYFAHTIFLMLLTLIPNNIALAVFATALLATMFVAKALRPRSAWMSQVSSAPTRSLS
jgi:hypothetical protein